MTRDSDSPTDEELIEGTADHDCRHRVRDGHAECVDVYEDSPHVRQLVYECDLCDRTVYLICEAINIQIEQRDDDADRYGSVLEPGADTDQSEIFDHPDLGPA
jgi:hypothetical protein